MANEDGAKLTKEIIMRGNIDTNYKVLELVIAEQSITDRPYWTHVENEDLDYDFDFNEAERVFNALVKQGRNARLVKVTTEVLQENSKGQGARLFGSIMTDLEKITNVFDDVGIKYTIRHGEDGYSYVYMGSYGECRGHGIMIQNCDIRTTDLDLVNARHESIEFQHGELVSHPIM